MIQRSDLLKDKNGKLLAGAALQQRLAKIAKESAASQPLLGVEMPDIEPLNYGEKIAEESLDSTRKFNQRIEALLLKLNESKIQVDYQTSLVQPTIDNNDSAIPLKDLTDLLKGVDDLTSLVVNQDLRINRLEHEINKNKVFGLAAKNLADVLLVGSFGGAILGLCLMLLYPNQTKLGTVYGFVGSASMALLAKLNPSPNQ